MADLIGPLRLTGLALLGGVGLVTAVLLAHPRSVAAAPTPQPAPATATATPSTNPLNDVEQRLRIRKLEQDTGFEARLRPYVPALAGVAGAAAAAFAVWHYFADRRLEHRLRVEENIATALGQLLDYPSDGKSFTGRLGSALHSLNRWISQSDDPSEHREQVTGAIVATVQHDIDFLDQHQVGFDAVCLRSWPQYRDFLAGNPAIREFILYRYCGAVEDLRRANENYFREMTVTDAGFEVAKRAKEGTYLTFARLVQGFERQLELIPGYDDRVSAVQRFGEALDNEARAREIFKKALGEG